MSNKKANNIRLLKKIKHNKAIFNIPQLLTIVILTSVFSILMGSAMTKAGTKSQVKEKDDAFSNFIAEYNKIKDNYYEEINDEEMMKNAIEYIVDSLDANSVVVDDNLSNILSTQLQGSFEGFGIEIANDSENNIFIVNVIEDTPASRAGLNSMDKIKMIDDINVEGKTTTEFINIVKESQETEFVLTIVRNGSEQKINITRGRVVLNSVATEIYEKDNNKIGYIYVSLFAYNTDVQFEEALNKLENDGIDSLIVDLRYNTGGHLTAVENMISEFLDKSHIIYQIQTKEETRKYYSKTDEHRDYKVAVLVNEYSASASEMFAAAMKEEYGAIIIGVPTFGKGTVQEVQNSVFDEFQYKLTTKKWLTPKGEWINEVGVKPNIIVEMENIETINEDIQLQTAINELIK